MVGTREVEALGSQLLAVGEVGEGQQNQGEVEKMEVMVGEGSQETQILQVVVEAACPLEVEVGGQAVGQSQVWGLVESPEEELEADGLG